MKIIIGKRKNLNEANLILELDLEQVKDRFRSKKFVRAVEANPIYEKDDPDRAIQSARGLILFLIPKDIEEKHKATALNWLISRFSEGDEVFARRSMFVGSENSRLVRNKIELFFQIKEQNLDRLLPVKDINQIQSLSEFWSILNDANKAYQEYNRNKISKTQAEAGKKLIYSDEEHDVYIPETKAAACELGKGTDWCTAAPGLDYYNRYHKEDDPLIVFKNKQDPSKDVQMHFGSGQFMDVNDRPIPERETIRLASKLKGNKALPEPILKKIQNVRFEKFEDGGYVITNLHGTTEFHNKEDQLHRVGGPAVEGRNGHKEWYLNGKRHRVGGPAAEYLSGHKEWFLDGKRHREDGPAVIKPNGSVEWWQNGEVHREDGPAIENYDGFKQWYNHGKIHRVGGPAIEYTNGDKAWYFDDELHRTDGPAIEEEDGGKEWYQNNKLHRTDGPAVIKPDGTKKWALDGTIYDSEAEWKQAKKDLGLNESKKPKIIIRIGK